MWPVALMNLSFSACRVAMIGCPLLVYWEEADGFSSLQRWRRMSATAREDLKRLPGVLGRTCSASAP